MPVLRPAVMLLLLAVLLPVPPEGARQGNTESVYETVATSTFSDLAAFCHSKPETCHAAGQIALDLEAKAKYGIALVYQWASLSDLATS